MFLKREQTNVRIQNVEYTIYTKKKETTKRAGYPFKKLSVAHVLFCVQISKLRPNVMSQQQNLILNKKEQNSAEIALILKYPMWKNYFKSRLRQRENFQ